MFSLFYFLSVKQGPLPFYSLRADSLARSPV